MSAAGDGWTEPNLYFLSLAKENANRVLYRPRAEGARMDGGHRRAANGRP